MTILAPDRGKPSYKVESMMPGPKDKNYTVYVIVHVADKHNAINTSTCIPIKVYISAALIHPTLKKSHFKLYQ